MSDTALRTPTLGAPFTPDAKLQPYWWEHTPRPTLVDSSCQVHYHARNR